MKSKIFSDGPGAWSTDEAITPTEVLVEDVPEVSGRPGSEDIQIVSQHHFTAILGSYFFHDY